MRVVGLSAKMGCGKSTVANYLLDMIPGAARLAFGDPVKTEASIVYGFPVELAYSEVGKVSMVTLSDAGAVLMGKSFATVREVLQFHGTELRRAMNKDCWLNAMVRALVALKDAGVPCVVVDDCRFQGEIDLLKNLGAAVYRIDPYPGWEPSTSALHESETALDDYTAWDMTFAPMKGLHHLEAVAHCIVEMMG